VIRGLRSQRNCGFGNGSHWRADIEGALSVEPLRVPAIWREAAQGGPHSVWWQGSTMDQRASCGTLLGRRRDGVTAHSDDDERLTDPAEDIA
jgi:hypothetical protein